MITQINRAKQRLESREFSILEMLRLHIKKLRNKFNSLSLIEKFFSISITTFLSWNIIYSFLLLDSSIDSWMISYAVNCSSILLDVFNIQTEVIFNEISVIGEKSVLINSGCNILKVFGFYISFIFGYPSSLRKKVTYTIIGFILLFLMNIFRISIFVLVTAHVPEFWYLVHKYSTFAIFYPVIIVLWLLLVKKT